MDLKTLPIFSPLKIGVTEARNSIFHYDLFANSESLPNESMENNDLFIEAFSKEIFRNDHPSGNKVGGVLGVCLFFKQNISIKHRQDLELIQETIVTEISLGRKRIFFVVVYRSPNQTSEEFNIFQENLQDTIRRIKDTKPHCIILTGDFNCRSRQWWPDDIDSKESIALNEFVESNDLVQLIDQPTNIEPRGISCVDLIITDQLNLFVDFGIRSSLDNCCHHQIIHGEVNLSVPSPPSYKREVWEYSKANKSEIWTSLRKVDWESKFTVDQMTKEFTMVVMEIIDRFIPNKLIKFDGKDPPWMTPEVKTAIKGKHRI